MLNMIHEKCKGRNELGIFKKKDLPFYLNTEQHTNGAYDILKKKSQKDNFNTAKYKLVKHLYKLYFV